MFGYESPLTTLGNRFMPDWIYFEKVGLIDRVSSILYDNVFLNKLIFRCVLLVNLRRYQEKDYLQWENLK